MRLRFLGAVYTEAIGRGQPVYRPRAKSEKDAMGTTETGMQANMVARSNLARANVNNVLLVAEEVIDGRR